MVVKELDRGEDIIFGRRAYRVSVFEWERNGRRGNFVSVEEFRLLRDDLRGDGVWKRRTQITITDANAARQIARDLEAFASFLEAEERKNEPSGGGENSSPNEPDNFRSDETSAEQPLFADILKVRNRPSAGNSSKEATRTEGGSS